MGAFVSSRYQFPTGFGGRSSTALGSIAGSRFACSAAFTGGSASRNAARAASRAVRATRP